MFSSPNDTILRQTLWCMWWEHAKAPNSVCFPTCFLQLLQRAGTKWHWKQVKEVATRACFSLSLLIASLFAFVYFFPSSLSHFNPLPSTKWLHPILAPSLLFCPMFSGTWMDRQALSLLLAILPANNGKCLLKLRAGFGFWATGKATYQAASLKTVLPTQAATMVKEKTLSEKLYMKMLELEPSLDFWCMKQISTQLEYLQSTCSVGSSSAPHPMSVSTWELWAQEAKDQTWDLTRAPPLSYSTPSFPVERVSSNFLLCFH